MVLEICPFVLPKIATKIKQFFRSFLTFLRQAPPATTAEKNFVGFWTMAEGVVVLETICPFEESRSCDRDCKAQVEAWTGGASQNVHMVKNELKTHI